MEIFSLYGELGSDDLHPISRTHSLKWIQWPKGLEKASPKIKGWRSSFSANPDRFVASSGFLARDARTPVPASLDLWAAVSTVKLGQELECLH